MGFRSKPESLRLGRFLGLDLVKNLVKSGLDLV